MFGSICHKHMPNARKKKLDDNSEAMIRWYHKTRTYRWFNPISGNIIISKDIVIGENETWNWESNNTTRKPL